MGDYLQFEDSGEKLKVVNLTLYTSFQSMLENEGLKHVLPGVREIEHGAAVYRQFYSIEQEKEF